MALLLKKKGHEPIRKVSVKSVCSCSCYITCSCECGSTSTAVTLHGQLDAHDCASEYYKKFDRNLSSTSV
jgi:hypothetical protein